MFVDRPCGPVPDRAGSVTITPTPSRLLSVLTAAQATHWNLNRQNHWKRRKVRVAWRKVQRLLRNVAFSGKSLSIFQDLFYC